MTGGWKLTRKQKGTIWDKESVPYLDCGGGYMSLHMQQQSLNYTFKMGAFHHMQIYFNKVDLTKQERINYF